MQITMKVLDNDNERLLPFLNQDKFTPALCLKKSEEMVVQFKT